MGPVPVAGLLLLLAWTFACLWFPLTDTDVWWHLAAGEWMADHKTFLRVDPFSASALGRPWIDLHWGFQLLSLALWTSGGAAALIAGKCLLVALAGFLALRPHLNSATAVFLLPMAGFGLYQTRFFLDVRPLAVTLAGLAALYAATTAHLRGRLRHPWVVILPVQILLANIQGLYPLGAFLVTCLWAGEALDRRRASVAPSGVPTELSLAPLGWTCAGTWLAGLITPYGLPGFLLPLALLLRITPLPGNVFSAEIAENLPLHTLALQDPAAAAPHLLLLLTTLWTFERARGRFSTGHALLLAGFALLGLMAQRNLPLLLLACLFASGRNLEVSVSDTLPKVSGREIRPGFRAWAGPAALILVAALAAPSIRRAWEYELPGTLETPFRFPSGAVAYMRAHPVKGPLFNELRFGGYLAHRLHPDVLPFVDGRMILRDADFYREFLTTVDHPRTFPAYADKHGFTQVLLPIGEDRRFQPLAAYLAREEGWAILYCDGAAAWLARPGVADSLALPRGPFDASHPMLGALKDRYAANSRLLALARDNLMDFLRAAGWIEISS
ncbi:MAG TPA: hypothetical protein VK465_06700 [Fibrobacteria bacterium]|nr:hypothetical protein [Fibrobacteria bacterium]